MAEHLARGEVGLQQLIDAQGLIAVERAPALGGIRVKQQEGMDRGNVVPVVRFGQRTARKRRQGQRIEQGAALQFILYRTAEIVQEAGDLFVGEGAEGAEFRHGRFPAQEQAEVGNLIESGSGFPVGRPVGARRIGA